VIFIFIIRQIGFNMGKIDIKRLNEAVEKALDGIFEEEMKSSEEKDVRKSEEQWHDEYVNNDRGDVVQARMNPESGKEEYKIPTRDTVFTTKDAAISALNEGKKRVMKITEGDIRSMIANVLNEMAGDEFKPNGYRGVSNAGGNEIQVNDSGDAARFRLYGGEPTDWMEIEFDENGVAYVDTPSGREMLSDYMRC
jgi:hypothetical protein